MNTAADFLSRTEVNPAEKLEMSIRNDFQTRAIDVNKQSSGIVEEEQIYILPDDEFDENELWEEKQNVRNQAQTETPNNTENNVTELQHFHKSTSGLNSCSEGHFQDNARIRLEQNNDIVLRNLKAKIEGNPFLASDYRYQHSPKHQKNRNQARGSDAQILHRHRNHFALLAFTADATPRRTTPSLT